MNSDETQLHESKDNRNDPHFLTESRCKYFLDLHQDELSPAPDKRYILIDQFPYLRETQLARHLSGLWELRCQYLDLHWMDSLRKLIINFDPNYPELCILDAKDFSSASSIRPQINIFLRNFPEKIAVVLGSGNLSEVHISPLLATGASINTISSIKAKYNLLVDVPIKLKTQ